METFLWIVGVISAIAIWIAIEGESLACPKCEKWFAEKHLSKNLIDKKTGVRTVTRTRSISGGDGEYYTERYPAQERFADLTYRNNYKCEFCGYQWYRTESETTNTFYDD